MHVVVKSPTECGVEDLENLKELAVKTRGHSTADVGTALATRGLGRVEGDYAWLVVSALRSAGVTLPKQWVGEFDAMLDYAQRKGWVSADGRAVRAHLEALRRAP